MEGEESAAEHFTSLKDDYFNILMQHYGSNLSRLQRSIATLEF